VLRAQRFARDNQFHPFRIAPMITKNIGMLVLAIYLILYGIATIFTIAIPIVVLGVLALIAGILILLGK
jgi:hypothetical protein